MIVLTVEDNVTLTGSVNADMTGATLTAHVKRPDASVIVRGADIVDALEGDWSFDVIDGDLTVPGNYKIEIAVVYSDGDHQIFGVDRSGKEIVFKVRNDYIV